MSDITYLPGKEPHEKEHRLIFKNVDRKGWDTSIKTYLKDDGYEMLKKALGMKPQAVIDEVKTSGLRGRGGAGFPTGIKWGFIPPKNTKPVYLICNADESEPGTFKDRYILHQDPHQLIEGMVISAFAVGAHTAYIYIREEFPEAAITLEKAIAEARKKGFLGKDILGSGFDLEIYVHRGAAAYICGEETGLIESLEGKRPYPRIKPPYFPAAIGLYMAPTIVNNVESLCHVVHILAHGGRRICEARHPAQLRHPNRLCLRRRPKTGLLRSRGRQSHHRRTPLRHVWRPQGRTRSFKAVIPGGSSAKILRCDESFKIGVATTPRTSPSGTFPYGLRHPRRLRLDGRLRWRHRHGRLPPMSWVLNNINHFYAHESCGQCTPCREGSTWMTKVSDRIEGGQATPDDVKTLEEIAYQIDGKTVCAFGEASAWPVEAMIDKYRDELLGETSEDNNFKTLERQEQEKFLSSVH